MGRRKFLNLALMGVTAPWACAIAADLKRHEPAAPLQLPALNWLPRSDWISVKSTGAAGDGKTDDTEAIQMAFGMIKSGVTIYFPPGIYRITRTLLIVSPDKKALKGVTIVGHGRNSRLVWGGDDGKAMIRQEGMAYSRWTGLDLDGADRASIGQHHFSTYTFETVHRKHHMAYRRFVKAGVYSDPTSPFAMAETSLENCLFERCGAGISFTKFNDYDISIDGCDFLACDVGVECVHGNFYIRNCHFESSSITDIISKPEHGCSVRRCTSRGSAMFLQHATSVGVLTVEGCAIASWRNTSAAITILGLPALVFDCTFTAAPLGAMCAMRLYSNVQHLISSKNVTALGLSLFNREAFARERTRIYEIPAGRRRGATLDPGQRFFKSVADLPRRVFDARRDFGAKGNGKDDDTFPLQSTINAARAYGHGALAYVPAGTYVISETLNVSGGNYVFGGAGMLATYLNWRGAQDDATIAVEDSDHIVVEHMHMERTSGIDILQIESGRPSYVTYDGLFLTRSNNPPFAGGLHCKGLSKTCTVIIPCICGNLHFIDCGAATVLVPLSYYGSLIVEGRAPARDGLLGMLSRFSGAEDFNVLVKDSQSIVMSDYYSEQSGNIFRFEGQTGDPAGRITLQSPKLHLQKPRATDVLEVHNYSGQISIGPSQFYGADTQGMVVEADSHLDLLLVGNGFYNAPLRVTKHGQAIVYRLGNQSVGKIDAKDNELTTMFVDDAQAAELEMVATALDDLRRLGEVDLRLNHSQ
jgi:hypothetical protein